MTIEEKIDAAYIEAVKANRDVCNQTSFSAGYLAAIEDIKAQEPIAHLFQHEDTGRMTCIDADQVVFGFEKNNPRYKHVCELYRLED